MTNIVCIKTGTMYGPEYVNRLYNMIKRNTTRDFRFVCFTDRRDGINAFIETRPLPYMLRGWWCKIPLFAPPQCVDDAQMIAMDLDIVITGNIDWLLDWRGDFCALSEWHTVNNVATKKYYNGSLWSLKPGTNTHVWDNFVNCGEETMKKHYSDQEYIAEQIPDAPTFNELFPKKVLGFNTHYWNLQPEDRPSVVDVPIWIFHGFPKPSEVWKKVGWVREHWQ